MIKQAQSKTISFYTFGCRLNQSETAVIQNSCEAAGFEVVDFSKTADIVVVNTCTVTENGDSDTRRLVNKINRLNPKARIALVGCQAQIQKRKLTALPNVYWVVGNARKFELASILNESTEIQTPQVITPAIRRKSFTIPVAGIDHSHTRANIKIQDGCDFFCSFCEIPYARGRARSREFNDIIKEVRILARAGHQEIIITGINVGTYAHEGKTILDVITAMEDIDEIKRIRISSIEPTTIPKELIQKMKGPSKLCRYIHIPLQSGDDTVLKVMERKYTVEEFSNFVQYVFETVSDVCIGTDVIVGFPGETEKQFQQTVDFLRKSPIHYFHVFSYSKRHVAKSREFTNEIPIPIIQRRSEILRGLSQRKRRVFFERMLKTRQEILFEEKKDDFWVGITDNYIRVKFKSNEDLHNQFKKLYLAHVQGPMILATE